MRISLLYAPILYCILYCFTHFWVKIWVNDFYSLPLIWSKAQNTHIALTNVVIIINTTKFVRVL